MAEGFITEAAMALLTTVLSRAAEEVKLPWTFKHDKKYLEQKLKRIQLLLCGASNKSFDNPLADDWLRKVKYVAYEADDLLDELAYEALKQRLKFNNHSQFKRKLRFFFTLHSNPVVLSFQMGHRMRQLMGSIEDVYKDAQLLGIKPVDLAGGPSTSVPVLDEVQLQVQRELVGGRGLIGREKDEANVISMLCHPENEDSDLSVVGIVGMGAIMVEGLITEATMAVFTRVLSRAAAEVRLAWNFKDDWKELVQKLNRLHMLLCGAADKTSYNPVLNDWLCKVKIIAYETDDFLDDLAYESLKRKLKFTNQPQLNKKLCFFFYLHSNSVVFSFRMAHRVKNLVGSIEDVFRDAQVLGIKPADLIPGLRSVLVPEDVQLQVQRELVAGRGLIGRDEDKANIIKLLCHPGNADRDLSVIAIVGMAGLGKTALSKRIYDCDEIRCYFEHKIWLCVSHDFTLKSVLVSLAEMVSGEPCNESTYRKMLQESLSGKRYLLVLDDIWDTMVGVWESFTSELLNIHSSKGTAVLVTTRSYQVTSEIASALETFSYNEDLLATSILQVYKLEGLDSEDSWLLFQQKLRVNLVSGSVPEAMARKMVKKCAGVPLAIRVLADLLRSMNTMENWREIENSAIWNLNINNGILPSLKLSFNYLPSAALKKCFAYCAIFPEDAVIRRETVIQLWMAQGFLHQEGSNNICSQKQMEIIGNEYFDYLVNNSFFLDLKLDDWGKVKKCKMHDTFRVLAITVWRQEWVILEEGVDLTAIDSDVRHLSLFTLKYPNRGIMKQIRTLTSENLDVGVPQSLLVHARLLRVLSLIHCNLAELPDSISLLKHLRYLDISENRITSVRKESVNKLYHLQTLRLRCTRFRSTFPKLPKALSRLVNLKYIYTHKFSSMGFTLKIPLESCLLQMSDARQSWGGTISDLESLNNLTGSLALWHLEQVTSKETARKANLGSKENIDYLDLAWSYSYNTTNTISNCEEVLEELQPHGNLKVLNIWYYKGWKFPPWLKCMKPFMASTQHFNLMQIKIFYCRNIKWLPTFSSVPFLKVLVVWGCDNLTTFPDMNGLNFLEKLQIGRCPILEGLPDVKSLTSLLALEIHNCGKMTSLPYGLSTLPNLIEMEIGPLCQDLSHFPFPSDINASCCLVSSLQTLRLVGWPKVQKLPDQLAQFTLLQTLKIGHFTALETLPCWLGNLTCLEKVELEHMINLRRLPSSYDMQPATKFRGFYARRFHCPNLLGIIEEESYFK